MSQTLNPLSRLFKNIERGSIALSLFFLTAGTSQANEPSDIEQHIAKGEIYAALEKVQHQLEEQPHQADLLIEAGKLNLSLSNFKKALTHLDHAAKIAPGSFNAPYHSGIAYLKQGHYTLAEEQLTQALRLNPHHKSVQALHFLAAIKNKNPKTSPEILLQRYPLRTEFPETYFIRALWHYSRAEIDMAEYFISAVADIVPHQKMLWYQSWLSDAGWATSPRATGL